MTDQDKQTRSGHSSSGLRLLGLLECFIDHPTMSLADVVKATGLAKTTAHRLLTTLERAGWLSRTPSGSYKLGLKPFQVGQSAANGMDLRTDARPALVELAAVTGDSVYLVVPVGHQALCLERIDGDAAVLIADLTVGGSQDLHLGAGPRALLAFNEDALLPALLHHGLTRRTQDTLAEETSLRADLADIRRRGYSISRGDATAGVGAIGAPVFDARGECVAAVSVGGLLQRVSPEREPGLVGHLLAATAAVSARLGHTAATTAPA